jgi:outer membrane protein TolC
MQNMVQAEVRDAWGKVTSGWEQLERYRQSILPRTEQSLQGHLAAFQTNNIDFLTMLDTYRMLQMVRMEYIMKTAEYVSSVALLERATGLDLQQ